MKDLNLKVNGNISPVKRTILINLYNAQKKYKNTTTPIILSYTRLELAYNSIKEKVIAAKHFEFKDQDLYFENLKTIDTEINNYKEKERKSDNVTQFDVLGNTKEINFDKYYDNGKSDKLVVEMKYQKLCYEYFIMLDDCMKNYAIQNKALIKKIVHLITIMEILLKLPVSFPQEIGGCVDELVNLENNNEKGCDSVVKRFVK